jgi:hypothetical protein
MVPVRRARYDDAVAGLDEASARSVLAAMQDRLARNPASALGVPARASAEEVRAAFLELTKLFHPVRFGRMATDIQKQANEVFLALRAAHDALAKAARHATGPLPVTPVRPAAGPASAATPSPAAAPNGARAPLRPMISQAHNGASAPATAPRLGVPRATPSGSPIVPASGPPRAGNPVRQSGAQPIVAPAATEAAAVELLGRQQWEPARTMLHQLRAREPASRRIPALMAYARGREAQLAGRVDDARVELQDALDLDPGLQLAKDALTELFRRRK